MINQLYIFFVVGTTQLLDGGLSVGILEVCFDACPKEKQL